MEYRYFLLVLFLLLLLSIFQIKSHWIFYGIVWKSVIFINITFGKHMNSIQNANKILSLLNMTRKICGLFFCPSVKIIVNGIIALPHQVIRYNWIFNMMKKKMYIVSTIINLVEFHDILFATDAIFDLIWKTKMLVALYLGQSDCLAQ